MSISKKQASVVLFKISELTTQPGADFHFGAGASSDNQNLASTDCQCICSTVHVKNADWVYALNMF